MPYVLRPEVGRTCRTPASRRINMIPSQKLGILMPNNPNVVPRLSNQEFGFAPAQTPSGIAKTVAMMMAKIANSMVAGRRVLMTRVTGSPYLKDLPKSPVATDFKNLQY